eukprot:CAMPEP_0180487640 /NCGR_PEP_ID=MMETSP1036_2-20121128/37627_1 /TAXON_ID=632150 /ORGANISM="Azadinium spinosum, Strain 3D9" /LENGTH=181 /DNA_ID=CAMNT_0022495655 /DNA_START=518 /DNA_END=1059 /DNA_ORIENTATION=+
MSQWGPARTARGMPFAGWKRHIVTSEYGVSARTHMLPMPGLLLGTQPLPSGNFKWRAPSQPAYSWTTLNSSPKFNNSPVNWASKAGVALIPSAMPFAVSQRHSVGSGKSSATNHAGGSISRGNNFRSITFLAVSSPLRIHFSMTLLTKSPSYFVPPSSRSQPPGGGAANLRLCASASGDPP